MIDKQKLNDIINSLENIGDRREELGEEAKNVLLDAKKNGFEGSIIKEILRLRKLKNSQFSDFITLSDQYMKALGMI